MTRITLLGHIGADAKATSLQDGRKLYTFSVADNYKTVNKDTGEEIEVVQWFNCSYFSNSEKVAAHLIKGHRVLVQGELRFSEYIKDGRVGRSNDITVINLNIIDYTDTATDKNKKK